MKKIIKKTMLVLAIIVSFTTITVDAKPAYCGVALQNCYKTCQGSALEVFCDTGCNIGYLMCGS